LEACEEERRKPKVGETRKARNASAHVYQKRKKSSFSLDAQRFAEPVQSLSAPKPCLSMSDYFHRNAVRDMAVLGSGLFPKTTRILKKRIPDP
jgi:hypothetical protein